MNVHSTHVCLLEHLSMLAKAKQSLSGVCTQAQAEVAQLQSQLQDAVTQQEALQEALHDMQSTIAVLREQIQQQAEGSSACDAGTHPLHGHQQRGSTAQVLSQATPASALVQALQQQVEHLKEISACLSDSQQQQQQQQHMKHQPARAISLDSPVTHSRACRDMAGNPRGLAGAHAGMMGSPRGWSASGATLKHECMMPPPAPRSMPSRRLPMSAYASPASQPASPRINAIKAHHPLSQPAAESAADDKCWCGRPKRLMGSVVATPLRYSTTGIAARTSPAIRRGVPLQTSSGRPDR